MDASYEKDLNDLKEQILKEGDTLVSKKDLLERFCEMDKEYNSDSWNLLQILANINILIGEEPCEDWMSRQVVNELFDSEIKMYEGRIESRKGSNYHDETERIREFRCRIANAEHWKDKIEELPPVKPIRKKCKWILYDYRTLVPREHGNIPNPYWRIPARYKTELRYCPYCGREIDYSEVDAEIEERAKNENN